MSYNQSFDGDSILYSSDSAMDVSDKAYFVGCRFINMIYLIRSLG
ncbi:hypothetical protein [Oceanospirillum sediminis]|nr:hypothetical protein [Oceanospirillum sediminis]